LQFQHPLPARHGRLPRGGPRPARGRAGPHRRLPPLRPDIPVRGTSRGARGKRAPTRETSMKTKLALRGAVAVSALSAPAFAERGSSGHLNILYWQAVSIMTPYLSGGTKDV